jgi:hypothetical protein
VTVDLDRHSEDHADLTGEVLERVVAFPALDAAAKMSERVPPGHFAHRGTLPDYLSIRKTA